MSLTYRAYIRRKYALYSLNPYTQALTMFQTMYIHMFNHENILKHENEVLD
jgi:hypothetical protein